MAPGRIINAGFVSHSVVLVLVCLWVACDRANGITFDLPPGKVECFYEDVHQGTVINGAFAVLQGGSHMDIDVSIFNPEDHQVYNVKREGEDKFQLKADHDGTYRFCFGNTVRFVFFIILFYIYLCSLFVVSLCFFLGVVLSNHMYMCSTRAVLCCVDEYDGSQNSQFGA